MNNTEELEELLNQGYRYALALCKSKEDAYDLVQDSYLKIIESNAPLVLFYLFKTIKSKFIDGTRKNSVQKKWFIRRNPSATVQQPAVVEPLLEKALNELPLNQREILFLSVVQGYTAKEIGELLEMPRGTVLSTLKRTKDKLRIQLTENENKS